MRKVAEAIGSGTGGAGGLAAAALFGPEIGRGAGGKPPTGGGGKRANSADVGGEVAEARGLGSGAGFGDGGSAALACPALARVCRFG